MEENKEKEYEEIRNRMKSSISNSTNLSKELAKIMLEQITLDDQVKESKVNDDGE